MSISELGVNDSVFLNTCVLIPLGEDHGADDLILAVPEDASACMLCLWRGADDLILAVPEDVDLHAPLPLT